MVPGNRSLSFFFRSIFPRAVRRAGLFILLHISTGLFTAPGTWSVTSENPKKIPKHFMEVTEEGTTTTKACPGHRFEIMLDKHLDEVCLYRQNYGNIFHLEALDDRGYAYYTNLYGTEDINNLHFQTKRDGTVFYSLNGTDIPKWKAKV